MHSKKSVILLQPLSPPQRLPLGFPIKIAIIEKKKKIESVRGTMGRLRRWEPLFSLSPSHRAPRALFFFLPRGASVEERATTRNFNYHIVIVTLGVLGAPHSEKFSQRKKNIYINYFPPRIACTDRINQSTVSKRLFFFLLRGS